MWKMSRREVQPAPLKQISFHKPKRLDGLLRLALKGFFALWNPVKFKFFVFTRSVLASHNTTGRHDKKLMLINYIKKR